MTGTAVAWPGRRLLITSTNGEHAFWLVIDELLRPVLAEVLELARKVVERVGKESLEYPL